MTNRNAGMFFLRSLLGIIIGLQGFGKVYTYGIWGVYDMAFKPLSNIFPDWALIVVLFFTTTVELIGGICLILGIARSATLYAVAAVLLLVSVGHGLESPVWDLQQVISRAILTAALLLLPREWDNWAVGSWWRERQKGADGL